MTDAARTMSSNTVPNPKCVAAQVEQGWPPRLQQIGREITERLEKARKQNETASNHLITVNKLIVEARTLCDGKNSFKKFRELFCPQLGKSQAYVLRAIGVGKRTLAELRTAERERKQRTRANQKAAANSGTVPEKSATLLLPIEVSAVEATSAATDSRPKPEKLQTTRAAPEAMRVFTVHTMELYKATNKRPPEHFSATAIPVEIIAQLGCFFTALEATLRNAEGAHSKPAPVLAYNGPGSSEEVKANAAAVADMGAWHE